MALRMGIIGTNFISEWFVAACARTGGRVVPAAIHSRDLDRARAFASNHGVGLAFDDPAAMADAVDAVYVASPISVHRDQALQAVAAGRHVLVEKTLGASASEVREVFAAADAAGVVAMEAVRNLHAPTHALVADALPRLGTLRQARLEKLQYSSRYDRFRAGELPTNFDPALGTSALADIGVYVLQPALAWFGTPTSACGSSVRLRNGFEGAGSMHLAYDGFVVDLAWSKITSAVAPSVILGEDGALTLDDLAEPTRIVLHPRGGAPEVLFEGPNRPQDTLHHELLAFADQVDAGATDPRWSRVTLGARRLMDDHLARS